MYNYRFDPAGRAINMNPLYQANLPTVYSPSGEITQVPVYDSNGKIKEYQEVKNNNKNTSLVTNTNVAPTTYSLNPDYSPLEDTQEEVYDEVAPKRKGGNIRKNYSQSSIVRAFK
jgi:hypothetical protein